MSIKFTIPVKPRTKKNLAQEIIGKKFGKLTILETYTKRSGKTFKRYVVCKCDCGNKVTTRYDALKSGHTVSCGCYHLDICKKGCKPIKHGKTNSRLYNVWQGMKQRCYYIKHDHYKTYGGIGIEVCEEWKNDFNAFYEWAMNNGYDENAKFQECTIDRIDPFKNYSPSNCRWVSQIEQSKNKRERKEI